MTIKTRVLPVRDLLLTVCSLTGFLRLGYGWVSRHQVKSGLLGWRVGSSGKHGAP